MLSFELCNHVFGEHLPYFTEPALYCQDRRWMQMFCGVGDGQGMLREGADAVINPPLVRVSRQKPVFYYMPLSQASSVLQ